LDPLVLAIVIPVLAATGLVATGRLFGRKSSDLLALVAVGGTIAMLFESAFRVGGGIGVYWLGAWQPRGGIALGIDLAADPVGIGLGLLICFLMAGAFVLMWHYRDTDAPHFQSLMLVFLAGMVGFVLSGDLFNMFVFFELMSVSAFALCGYLVEGESIEGSINFAITNTLGSFFLVLGIALVYARTGALNLAQAGQALAAGPHDGLVVVALALLVTGFLIKAAIVPFHFWLADAYAVAPTPVCLLFAGAMSELGVYAIARIWFGAFSLPLADHADSIRLVLVIAGCLTALLGGAMAMAQGNLKRLLAFVTISYSGVALMGVGLLSADGVAAAGLFTVADGFAKAALFAGVGIAVNRFETPSIRRLHGRLRRYLGTAAVICLGVLSLVAIPPFGSFYAKAMLEDALSRAGYDWAIALLIATSVLTSAAVAAAGLRVFAGAGEPAQAGDPADEKDESEVSDPEGRPSLSFYGPALVFALAALATGLVHRLFQAVELAADRLADTGSYSAAVLHGRAVAALAYPPPFEAKPSAYLYAAITAALAVGVTACSLYPRRLRIALERRPLAALRRPLIAVRALHSGHIGDYVAFACVGAASFGTALMIATR
jgi:multicomponent Na+:H+ antiporter subunit D